MSEKDGVGKRQRHWERYNERVIKRLRDSECERDWERVWEIDRDWESQSDWQREIEWERLRKWERLRERVREIETERQWETLRGRDWERERDSESVRDNIFLLIYFMFTHMHAHKYVHLWKSSVFLRSNVCIVCTIKIIPYKIKNI